MWRKPAVIWAAIAVIALWVAAERGLLTETIVLFLLALIPAIILHEVSHGVVALVFGDDTAKKAGRLTLNPISHVDPFGTVILPGILLLTGSAAIGYAKPVPVTPSRLRQPRQHSLLVGLAGPATNLGLAGVVAVLYRGAGLDLDGRLGRYLWLFGFVNVLLAFFNMIPIPPLDGSAVVERLLPDKWWPGYLRFRQYSMVLLLLVFLWLPGFFAQMTEPAIWVWQNLAA
ncbi:MAG: site-2 protease family protein [Acidimicrobiales bacterium]